MGVLCLIAMGANNHPTVVPSNADQFENSDADNKYEDLALDIVKRTHFETDTVEAVEGVEVYVDVESYSTDALAGMDAVCAIAFDHGFVPVGIIESGAARFRPRDDDEVNSNID